jgi:NADH-quinone oxidoreductase subunit N
MIQDFAGLWSVRPWLALAMSIAMLSLLGFPIFGGAGFFAKWYLLQAGLQAPVPQTLLVVTLVLTTVLSAGYYLYVVMVMTMRPRPDGALPPERTGGLTRVVLALSVGLILLLGVVPESVVRFARAGRPTMEVEPITTVIPTAQTAPQPQPDSAQRVAEARAAQATR